VTRPRSTAERDDAARRRIEKAAAIDWTPSEIAERLCVHVVGQEEAVRAASVALYQHLRTRVHRAAKGLADLAPVRIAPIMFIGPTGCGKSQLMRAAARLTGLPAYVADAASLTAEGYVGSSVGEWVRALINASDGCLPLAEVGIMLVDELDKKAGKAAYGRDVSGVDAQDSLLRLLDTPGLGAGNAISLPTGAGLVVASGVAAPLTAFSDFAGWSTLPSVGRGTVGDLLFGTVLAGGTTLTSAWSTDSVFPEQYSDVLSLSGTGAGNPFVLSMSYDASTPVSVFESLNIWRRPGTSGPFAPIGTTFAGVGVPWTSGFTTIGQYGVDTASQTVWVVSDTNSQFVIVPEPATLALAAAAAAGIALALRRRRR